MEINKEQVHGMLDLLETMDESANHMMKQLEELRIEETIGLFKDFLAATIAVNSAVTDYTLNEDSHFLESSNSMVDQNDLFAAALIAQDSIKANDILKNQLIPAFKNWENIVREFLNNGFVS